MKTNKFLLLFMVVNTILVYFFRYENFWFLIWFNTLLIIPNEIFSRLVLDSKMVGLVIMGYSLAFMVSFTLMLTWHGAILLGMFLGLFFGICFSAFGKTVKKANAS